MKFIAAFAASVLTASAILSVMPINGEHEIYDDVLRLHVIAESDSEEDQSLKLKVRDAVLDCITSRVTDCTSFDEAYGVVSDMQDEIKSAAELCVKENGEDCSVTVSLGLEQYPRRDYGSFCLPAGTYHSLKITLGEGQGHNWWCVLFPTVCIRFAEADESTYIAAGFTPEEYRIITGSDGGWKIKFRILEILEEWLAR